MTEHDVLADEPVQTAGTETTDEAVNSRRNQRLAEAMRDAGLNPTALGAAVGRHYKSVQRWIYEGRVPHTVTQQRVARTLGIPASVLWPAAEMPATPPDLVRMYVDIREVPSNLWVTLIETAEKVAIASDAYPFLPDPGIAKALELRAAVGVPIRLCFGPTSALVRIPGSSVTVRRTAEQTISLFQFGEAMLVWLNWGGPSLTRLGPVLHLQRVEDNGVHDAYAHVLAEIWAGASEARRPW